jgi:hypothetical protein
MHRKAEEEVIAVPMADDENAARCRLVVAGGEQSCGRQTTMLRRWSPPGIS